MRDAQGMEGATHFPRILEKVETEMSLQVLAYNLKRLLNIFGIKPLMEAILAQHNCRPRLLVCVPPQTKVHHGLAAII